MTAVGFQNNQVVLPPGPDQCHSDAKIDRRCRQRYRHSQVELCQRLRMDEPLPSGHRDTRRRDKDQRPLEAAGEILCLPVTECMTRIRRSRRKCEYRQRKNGRNQINQRLRRIG